MDALQKKENQEEGKKKRSRRPKNKIHLYYGINFLVFKKKLQYTIID